MKLYNFSVAGNVGTFTFDNQPPIVVDRRLMPEEMQTVAYWHGIKQKVADGAALSRNPATGASASDADKIARMRAVATAIMAGQWRQIAAAPGEDRALLGRAMARAYPNRDSAEVAEFVAAQNAQQIAALLASSRLATHVAAIRDEMAGGIDADTLLSGWEDDTED